ncbi:MAG: endonuclease Q family protein [Candidatus Pacearchaeota archaeon]
MKIIADLHLHSKYARATSKDINFENLEKYARIKGINLLGTGDFQHPEWFNEIKKNLREDKRGILWTKTGFPFLWQTELSFMYSQSGKRRAIHLVVLSPNEKTSLKIIDYLKIKGRLDYDGRPIFGMSIKQFVKETKEIDDKIEIIPAHAFTPWFGLYGSDSGFDSIEEAFGEQAKHIYAIESGMSASPDMIWRLREFIEGKINVVSFSDSHSFWPWRLGREATIFEIEELSYEDIIKAIREGEGLVGTIETPPEYGKYHYDGHRKCNFSCSPEESLKLGGICPVCKNHLTIGVDYRIGKIAVKEKEFQPKNAKNFYKLTPLHELIAFHLKTTQLSSKKVWEIYNNLIENFGNEFNVLLNVSKEELERVLPKNEELIEMILENREGKIEVIPGYDGVYGKIKFKGEEFSIEKESNEKEIKEEKKEKQKKLF